MEITKIVDCHVDKPQSQLVYPMLQVVLFVVVVNGVMSKLYKLYMKA